VCKIEAMFEVNQNCEGREKARWSLQLNSNVPVRRLNAEIALEIVDT
jgi:hypothetical protein